jgi:hypothetical protein
MTDAQSNQLDMYGVVKTLYTAHQAVIDTVTARANAFAAFNANVTAINAHVANQSLVTSGVTADKAQARETLNSLTFVVFQLGKAWAKANDDLTSVGEFDFSPSELAKVKDDSVLPFIDHRRTIITANAAALVDYGITPALMTEWTDAITAFGAFNASPRTAIVSRKTSTAQLRNLFKATQTLLRDTIDPLMLLLKVSHPELYAQYLNSRIIIDRKGPGNGPTPPTPLPQNGLRIAGTVRSQNGNMGIPNALVRAYNAMQGPGSGTMEVFTGADGSYLLAVDDLPEPLTLVIEVSAAGYPSQGRNLNVAPGQTYEGEDFNL